MSTFLSLIVGATSTSLLLELPRSTGVSMARSRCLSSRDSIDPPEFGSTPVALSSILASLSLLLSTVCVGRLLLMTGCSACIAFSAGDFTPGCLTGPRGDVVVEPVRLEPQYDFLSPSLLYE